jgi:hypothetical protein
MEEKPFRCGQCMESFDTLEEVHSHPCPALNGLTNRDPEAMGENHAEISAAALARGTETPSY